MNNGDAVLFMMLTIDHAMCIKLKIKNNNFVVYFYDPNITNGYKKFYISGEDKLLKFKASNFMPVKEYDYYRIHDSIITLVLYHKLPKEKRVNFYKKFYLSKALGFSLRFGLSDTMISCLESAFAQSRSPTYKAQLIAAKNEDDVPGLYFALTYGHTDMVVNYLRAVLDSELSPQSKKSIITAKPKDGPPGLFRALQNGHANTVAAYLVAVLSSRLPDNSKINIAAAKSKEGIPGLDMALRCGHADTVAKYLEAVLCSNLTTRSKSTLIAAKDEDGTSSLYIALHKGYAGAVAKYVEVVLGSELPPESKMNIIVANCEYRAHGVYISGLYMALQNGHADTVANYLEAVLGSSLPLESKIKLIAAKASYDTRGLLAALTNNHFAAADAYFNQIMNANESAALIVELLNVHRHVRLCWDYLKRKLASYVTEAPETYEARKQIFASAIDLHRDPSIFARTFFATATRRSVENHVPQQSHDRHFGSH